MRRVADPALCYVLNDVLKDVLRYGTAARTRQLGFTRPFAGKTGTTNNYRDAWFIGYSPRVLSLVWVGFDDGHSVRLAGGDACVPIWTAHMNRIIGMIPDVDFRRPEGVVERQIDPESGMLATPYCPTTRSEVFVEGTQPTEVCSLHTGAGGELPSPQWADRSERDSEGRRADQQAAATDQQQPSNPQRARKESGLQRLLHRIFGH